MSFETREQNESSQLAEEKPSKAGGWAITVVGIVVLAVVVSFPMWGADLDAFRAGNARGEWLACDRNSL